MMIILFFSRICSFLSSFFFPCFVSSQFLSTLFFFSVSLYISVSQWNNNRSNHRGNTLNSCDEVGLTIQPSLEWEKTGRIVSACAVLRFIFLRFFYYFSYRHLLVYTLHFPYEITINIKSIVWLVISMMTTSGCRCYFLQNNPIR